MWIPRYFESDGHGHFVCCLVIPYFFYPEKAGRLCRLFRSVPGDSHFSAVSNALEKILISNFMELDRQGISSGGVGKPAIICFFSYPFIIH